MPVGFPDFYGGLSLPVTVLEGGTGQTTLETNGVLIGQGSSGVAVVAPGSAGDVLQVPSGGGAPVFQPLDISLVSLTGILPIANGGTDLAALGSALQVLRVNSGVSGLEYATVDLASAMVSGILPTANGGTGSDAPALVAGANIALSGSWPNNTIAVLSSPSFSGHITCVSSISILTDTYPALRFENASGTIHWILQELTNSGSQGTFELLNYVSGNPSIQVSAADVVSLYNPLPVSSGGTGAASLTDALIWTTGGYNDKLDQTASLTNQSLIASATGRRYMVAVRVHIHNASGAALSVNLSVSYTMSGSVQSQNLLNFSESTVGDLEWGGAGLIYPDSGTAVIWATGAAGFGSGDYYDAEIVALAQ